MAEQETFSTPEQVKKEESRRGLTSLVLDIYGPSNGQGTSTESKRILTEEMGLDISAIDGLSPNQRPLLSEIIETLMKQLEKQGETVMTTTEKPDENSYTSSREKENTEDIVSILAEIDRLKEAIRMVQSDHSGLPEEVAAKLISDKELAISENKRKLIDLGFSGYIGESNE